MSLPLCSITVVLGFAPLSSFRYMTLSAVSPTTDWYNPRAGPVGERSHTVHAYCVNTLAGEVFTRVNTFPWQVFTHLLVNPKKFP